eukprot:COSAG06_NODE_44506_length_363_cov_0.553030_2_plen_36_part_01
MNVCTATPAGPFALLLPAPLAWSGDPPADVDEALPP